MSTTVSYKGNTIATVENNTKTLKTAGKYLEGDVVLTDVSGASNIVTGTFNFDSGGTKTLNIPYTGNGYPISITIFVADGPFNTDTTWGQSIRNKAIGHYSFTKLLMNTAPTYTGSGNENSGRAISIYKNSTSDSNSYSSNSYDYSFITRFYGGTPSQSYAEQVITMKNATTMNINVYFTNYSFAKDIDYVYIIVYSE